MSRAKTTSPDLDHPHLHVGATSGVLANMSADPGPFPTIRVLLADDHPIVRQGLEAALRDHRDLLVVGSTPLGPDALAVAEAAQPDVMVVGPDDPQRRGLGFLSALWTRRLPARVLVFSNHDGDELIHEALAGGAVGYLLKTTPVAEVVAAIRSAAHGRVRLSPEVAGRLADRHAYARLSEREIEVLRQAAAGRSNKLIAAGLGITENTVKNHMRSIMSKLQASDRTQSVTLALRRGIIGVNACYCGPSAA
jgi:DNA-binding NarL/FixJ family response regulator